MNKIKHVVAGIIAWPVLISVVAIQAVLLIVIGGAYCLMMSPYWLVNWAIEETTGEVR